MANVAKGGKRHDVKANVEKTCKDTNEQVICLINLTTDRSILRIMWNSWSPYL